MRSSPPPPPPQQASHTQPRAAAPPRHRRNKPQLNIDVFHANDYSRSPDYDDDFSGLSTPLSPPPSLNRPAHAPSPSLPAKSSSRSLTSAKAPRTPLSAQCHPNRSDLAFGSSKGPKPGGRRLVSAPVSAASIRPASPGSNKVSAQSGSAWAVPSPAQRDARARAPRLRIDDRDPDADRHWINGSPLQTLRDTLPQIDMSHTRSDSPPTVSQLDPFGPFDSSPRDRSPSPPSSQGRLRDSHDLSLSPRNVTRDSFLGNMLLSLDQFSMGQVNGAPAGASGRTMSGFAEPSFFYDDLSSDPRASTRTRKTPPSRTSRAGSGGPAHGCFYSSDYEPAPASSRVASNVARGGRSNSSSTAACPSHPATMDSTGDRPRPRAAHRTNSRRASHARREHGSKSSSTSSMEAVSHANARGSPRWARRSGTQQRSSSLDMAPRNDSPGRPPDEPPSQQRRPWRGDVPSAPYHPAGHFDDYLDDAAPTPTVPSGPRRDLSTRPSMPSFGRTPPMGEPLSPVRSVHSKPLERSRSSKSPQRPAAGVVKEPAPARPPLPEALVVSSSDLADPAPAPHVGYEKAKENESVPSPAPVSQPREKQGFFRRMFGGGAKSSPEASVAATSPTDSPLKSSAPFTNTMSTNTSTAASTPRVSPPNASPVQPPSKSTSSTPSRQASASQANGLQKKSSGFFRRRKKSISLVTDPLPPTPILLPVTMAPPELPAAPRRVEALTPRPVPSPVGSLRKAMDPFLNSPQTATSSAVPSPLADLALSEYHSAVEEINHSGEAQPRSFSPDYEPDARATIRPVESVQKFPKDTIPAAETPRPWTPTRDVSNPSVALGRDGSFLHDISDSEVSPRGVRRESPVVANNGRPISSSSKRSSLLAPIQTNLPLLSPTSRTTARDKKLDRLTQDSTSTTATERPNSLQLPIEGARTEPDLKPRVSAASIPSLMVEDSDVVASQPAHLMDEPDSFVVGEPTADERAKAQRIFDGNEDFIPKWKAASWMGEEGPIRQRTLRAYMDLYNFTHRSIVQSLRDVCNRLVLRAETQQVDRILVTFSQRWVDCNPHHGFKSTDVIHTICYSIMLLNTDLHMADIESKMTRSQFIKNTMGTVRRAAVDSASDAFDRPSILPGKGFDDARGSVEPERTTFRNSFLKINGRAGSALGEAPADLEDCGPLVRAPFEGSLKAWESQMEVVLKEIYCSIRDEKLPLFGAEVSEHLHAAGGLSVIGILKRSPSVLSKAPSENPSTRGRGDSMLAGNSRWASKSRSRPRGYANQGLSSSRTSFDDGQSIWSPVESVATWSRASLGRTHTSISMDSFGSRLPRGDFSQSIGFANALSQAIIREDPRGSVPSLASDELKTTHLLDDDSLELAGPPWAKEGIVMHKHHLDGIDKKARDRNWSEVFCVIQKGNVSIFSFSPNKSASKRGRNAAKKGGVVGGGNWQDNATNLGTWNLRLCLASAIQPPGYSKQRPHVWALSLPGGGVHLFHVGTPEIGNEFVLTANYWAARLSTHPLVGGVSNMEYGWSDAIINNALINAINENSTTNVMGTTGPTARQRSGSVATRTSLHSRNSSFRSVSSFDFGSATTRSMTGLNGSSKLPGDIVTIAEWTAPTQSMRASQAPEKEQLHILDTYVKGIEEELRQHNALRSPMLLAFTPRGSNAHRAMANWERKSAYLLREIIKFRTFVDVLRYAAQRKAEVYDERDIARRAARGSLTGQEALPLEGEEEQGDHEKDLCSHLVSRAGIEVEGDATWTP